MTVGASELVSSYISRVVSRGYMIFMRSKHFYVGLSISNSLGNERTTLFSYVLIYILKVFCFAHKNKTCKEHRGYCSEPVEKNSINTKVVS